MFATMRVLALPALLALHMRGCCADVYMHVRSCPAPLRCEGRHITNSLLLGLTCWLLCQAPRGSNNRVNEQNTNRNNNNRLFDSQNNNKGGYSVGVDADDYTGEDNVRLHSRNSPILLPSCCISLC